MRHPPSALRLIGPRIVLWLAMSVLLLPGDTRAQTTEAASGQDQQQKAEPKEDICGPPMKVQTAVSPTPTVQPNVSSAGSLWSGHLGHVDLFTDLRARNVGDLLTIRIIENVRAQQAAETDSNREANVALGISQLFGLQNYAPDNLGLANLLGATSSSDFKGGGSNSRTNALSTTITATVIEVRPGGQLVVEASRFLKVNHEEERLTLRGTVRGADVSPTNVVLSTSLANVEIRYGGKGVIGSNLKPGILMRIVRFLF